MNNIQNIQLKNQTISKFILLWLVIWYLIGFLSIFISGLPSVSTWSIQESITCKGNFFIGSCDIEPGSIVDLLILSVTWPIILVALYTVGLLVGGEVVGYEYSSNLPLLILLYYVKMTQTFLLLFLIGIISGFTALIIVKQRISRMDYTKKKQVI